MPTVDASKQRPTTRQVSSYTNSYNQEVQVWSIVTDDETPRPIAVQQIGTVSTQLEAVSELIFLDTYFFVHLQYLGEDQQEHVYCVHFCWKMRQFQACLFLIFYI